VTAPRFTPSVSVLAAGAAAILALLTYLHTLAPGLTEIDSGELAGVAATLGIAHPSGYPLFAIVGRVWVVLAGVLRPIRAMNVLSALLAAGAVFLVYATVRDAVRPSAARREPGPAALTGAWVGAFAFALNGLLWSVATVTEVHALQMFLDAALLYAVVRAGLWGRGAFCESACLLAFYLCGLCLTNHLTSALLVPGFALGLWRRRRVVTARLLLGGVALALLGASVYAYLPLRSSQFPTFDWGAPRTWYGFVRHVTGAQYRVWMFTSPGVVVRNLGEFLSLLPRSFTPLLLALAAPGLWRARRLPGLLAGTATMAFFALAYPLGYDIHDIETYFLPVFLIFSLWIGLGGVQVAEWLGARGSAAKEERGAARGSGAREERPTARGAVFLFLLPVVPLLVNARTADRSQDRWVEEMARSFLAVPRDGSVVVSAYWDVLVSPALYLREVEGVRRDDFVLLDQEHFRRTWYLPWIRRHYPEVLAGLDERVARFEELLARFEHGRPYDQAEIQAAFESVVNGILANGMRGGGAYVTQEIEAGIGSAWARIPTGLLFRLEDPFGEASLPEPAPWPELPPRSVTGEWPDQARGYAARMAAFAGHAALRLGETARAREEFERALRWNLTDRAARKGMQLLEAQKTPPGG
jgi:hypothetical protein